MSDCVCTAILPFLGTALAMSSVSETRNPGSKSLMLEGEGLMDLKKKRYGDLGGLGEG